MARRCSKCGANIGDKARFCGKCGEVVQDATSVASAESIPTWSGWDTPATVAPSPAATPAATSASRAGQNGTQTSAMRFSQPAQPTFSSASQPAAVQTNVPTYTVASATVPPATNAASFTASPSAPVASTVPASGASEVAGSSSGPQFWESYDFQGSTPNQPQTFAPSRSASRPLPKLDDIAASGSSGNEGGDDFGDVDDDLEAKRAKAYDTATTFSLWCAGLVLFPLPFIDLVFLAPIQAAMVVSISKIYGVKQSPEKFLAVLAGSCGVSVIGQFTTLLGASLLPVLGKLLSAPFVFGWSYGMGEVAIRYFESKGTATQDELKSIFKKASKEASHNYDGSKVNPNEALENIRNYVSEDEYRKIRERFGPKIG